MALILCAFSELTQLILWNVLFLIFFTSHKHDLYGSLPHEAKDPWSPLGDSIKAPEISHRHKNVYNPQEKERDWHTCDRADR
jgi:hypothetical protein